MTTLGRHPNALTVKLTLGDGAHLVATSANGWAGPVTLHYGPRIGDPVISDVGTVDGDEVSWTLTEAQVEARAAHDFARLEDNGVTLAAGSVITWRGGLGTTATQTIASLTAGPPGPTAVSADADNVATLGTDGLIYVPESVGGGNGGTITATDTPVAPAEGASASYLVTSAVTWPAGLVWSTDPDGGEAPTITDTALVSLFTLDGTTYAVMGATFTAPPDTTGPTAGTLGVVVDVTSADGTVTGAADETELDAAPYSFRIDAGTYSAWQAGATYEWTGLDPDTSHDFQHRVRDAAGNVTEGTVVTDTTDADVTGPTAGTLGVVPGVTTADLTVTGASDDIALHATPYAYSTDNGSTWSAYQAGATYEATGLTADTEYTFHHKVRDAAGNETLGTAVTDSTDPEPADATPPTPGTLAASAITSSGFTLTVTGASDDEALHAQPYRFSTDNGATYSAYQTAATFDATGLDPETEYTCIHQVRDAALNVATGTSVLVTTDAAALGFSVEFTGSASDPASGTSRAFTSQPIGTASAERTVVVAFLSRGGEGKTVSSVTIGGVAATVALPLSKPTETSSDVAFAYAAVPTGTTATVAITYGITSTTPTQCAIGVWVANGPVAIIDTAAGANTATVTATAADQVMLAAGERYATTGTTWTGITEDFEIAPFDTSWSVGGGSTTSTVAGDLTVSQPVGDATYDVVGAVLVGPA